MVICYICRHRVTLYNFDEQLVHVREYSTVVAYNCKVVFVYIVIVIECFSEVQNATEVYLLLYLRDCVVEKHGNRYVGKIFDHFVAPV